MRMRLPTGRAARRVRAVWAPSLVRRIVRSRLVLLVATMGAAGLAVVTVQDRAADADAARAAWGASSQVLVVADSVGAGQPVHGRVELVERPAAMVPEGAVSALPDEAIAAVDLVVGEVLLQNRLVGGETTLRPAGTVAVTVAIDGAAALVEPGDLVDLWSTDVATLTSVRVVAAVVVLDRTDDTLTVAVPESSMADVAVAALRPLTIAQR